MKKRVKASRKRMQSRNNRYQKSQPGIRRRINDNNEQTFVGNRAMRRKGIAQNRKAARYAAAESLVKELANVAT